MCGCLSNKTSSNNRTVQSTKLHSMQEVNRVTINCFTTYEEIRDLDLKVLKLLKNNNDSFLKELNRQLIFWFRNINNECPPEEDFNLIKEYIEDEYTKHNT